MEQNRFISQCPFLQGWAMSSIRKECKMKQVEAHIKQQVLPKYELGKPEINPVIFEKRVYQGSSGKVYPVSFIDKVFDQKMEK